MNTDDLGTTTGAASSLLHHPFTTQHYDRMGGMSSSAPSTTTTTFSSSSLSSAIVPYQGHDAGNWMGVSEGSGFYNDDLLRLPPAIHPVAEYVVDEEAMAQIMGMGFDVDSAREATYRYPNDVARAIDYLLNKGDNTATRDTYSSSSSSSNPFGSYNGINSHGGESHKSTYPRRQAPLLSRGAGETTPAIAKVLYGDEEEEEEEEKGDDETSLLHVMR